MHSYYFKIEVTGRGQFPLDQLRRFEMFPIDIETTQAIQYSFDHLDNSGHRSERTYTLGMNAQSLGADQPSIDRFASFGFNAVTLEVWRPDGTLFAARPEAQSA